MNRQRRRRTFLTANTTSRRSRKSSRNLTKFAPPPEAKEASWFSPGRLFFFATPSGSTAWCSSTPDRGNACRRVRKRPVLRLKEGRKGQPRNDARKCLDFGPA